MQSLSEKAKSATEFVTKLKTLPDLIEVCYYSLFNLLKHRLARPMWLHFSVINIILTSPNEKIRTATQQSRINKLEIVLSFVKLLLLFILEIIDKEC